MKKILLVLKQEIIVTIARRSFILTTLGLPLVSFLIFAGASALNRRSPDALGGLMGSTQSSEMPAQGYVDPSGFIRTLPTGFPENALIEYPDEPAALQALKAGQVEGYYLISPDYLETGRVVYVNPDVSPMSTFGSSGPMQWVLQVNLLGGDPKLASRVQNPFNLNVQVLAPKTDRDQGSMVSFYVPYAVTMIYYFVLVMSASLLLNSITKEKENRVMEILMSSITPRQMLTGKIIGLGVAGLIQCFLWFGTGYVLLRLSGQSFNLPQSYQLPPTFLVWAVVFFLLGYIVYASLMAAVGALVPNLREASQATFVVILPMLIPLMLISVLIDDPNGVLSIFLSLFPLTSPVTMMTRMAAAGSVPFWQLLAAAALLLVTAWFIVRAVSGLFRAQTLLSGQPFSLKLLFNALSGRS